MLTRNQMLNMPIVLLRDGVDDSQGMGQILTNIKAACSLSDMLKTTLGPKGMDKLIYDANHVTISNDGATIIQELKVEHPAARIMADISLSQDKEVGDGTTSVILLAGELLSESKNLIEDKMVPFSIIKGYQQAAEIVFGILDELVVDLSNKTEAERYELYTSCASVTLNSKILGGESRTYFSKLAVDACKLMGVDVTLDQMSVCKVVGGSASESMLIQGVAFAKTFSYAGFELAPKSISKPKIMILNHELELKAEKDNAEARIKNPEEYKDIVNAEWKIIYDKLESIVATGADVVLSKLPIGDVATQYLADRDIFCAGRVDAKDIENLAKTSGARIQTSLFGVDSSVLGTVDSFEEKQISNSRYNIFRSSSNDTCTVILRGGANQFVEEAERSFHDAICVVRRCMKTNQILPGGGAVDLYLSSKIRDKALTIKGRLQLILMAYAKALEVIPRTLASNAGLDSNLILNKLRYIYSQPDCKVLYGVDCTSNEGIVDTYSQFIWEPALVKRNSIASATEAACAILSIDETIKHPSNRTPDGPNAGGRGMR